MSNVAMYNPAGTTFPQILHALSRRPSSRLSCDRGASTAHAAEAYAGSRSTFLAQHCFPVLPTVRGGVGVAGTDREAQAQGSGPGSSAATSSSLTPGPVDAATFEYFPHVLQPPLHRAQTHAHVQPATRTILEDAEDAGTPLVERYGGGAVPPAPPAQGLGPELAVSDSHSYLQHGLSLRSGGRGAALSRSSQGSSASSFASSFFQSIKRTFRKRSRATHSVPNEVRGPGTLPERPAGDVVVSRSASDTRTRAAAAAAVPRGLPVHGHVGDDDHSGPSTPILPRLKRTRIVPLEASGGLGGQRLSRSRIASALGRGSGFGLCFSMCFGRARVRGTGARAPGPQLSPWDVHDY